MVVDLGPIPRSRMVGEPELHHDRGQPVHRSSKCLSFSYHGRESTMMSGCSTSRMAQFSSSVAGEASCANSCDYKMPVHLGVVFTVVFCLSAAVTCRVS